MSWTCAVGGCGNRFERAGDLIRHQVLDHAPTECGVCEARLPAGFPAIRHAFSEHTRAEYVRAYDADSDDIRVREQIKDEIEAQIDVDALLDRLEADSVPVPGD